MVKCCSFSAVKSFLWFWSLSNGTEAKQFLMILHRTDNLLSYFDEFFNLLYILFACVLLFTFVKIHTLGNYLVALFLLTQTNAKFKKRLCLVRVPHCSFGHGNFNWTLRNCSKPHCQSSSTLVGRRISPMRTLIAKYMYIYRLTQKPCSLDYAPNASTLNPIKAIRGLLLGAK